MAELNYLDGPGFVAWIEEEEGGEISHMELRLGSHARKIRRWRSGGHARVGTADLVLNKLGLYLGHVPDHLYIDKLDRERKPPEVQREIAHRVLERHEPPASVARAVGCHVLTVRRYARPDCLEEVA